MDAPSTVEETALALDALVPPSATQSDAAVPILRGLDWLLDRIDRGTWSEPSPIGFYFAKLWYFEKLYPMIFTVAALRRGVAWVESFHRSAESLPQEMPPGKRKLTRDEMAVIERWIAAGAEYRPHRAFVPPQAVPPPPGAAHPVDAFVRARLRQEGLQPAPEADRLTLADRKSTRLNSSHRT